MENIMETNLVIRINCEMERDTNQYEEIII